MQPDAASMPPSAIPASTPAPVSRVGAGAVAQAASNEKAKPQRALRIERLLRGEKRIHGSASRGVPTWARASRVSVVRAMRRPRRASEFDFELLLGLMVELRALTEDQRRLASTRERAQRVRLLQSATRQSLGLHNADLSPIEILASFQFPDARKRPDVLDEDRICQAVATFAGLPHRRIDRLSLDAALITRTLSRTYARKHCILPLEMGAEGMVVAVSNPFDDDVLGSLRSLVRKEIVAVVAGPSEIQRAIAEIYGFRASIQNAQAQIGGRKSSDLEQFFTLAGTHEVDPAAGPIVAAVDFILNYAFDQRASDIHVEPQRDESVVRMRIDGVLHAIYRVPRPLHAALTNRIKIMSRLDIASRKPQDGRIRVGRGETDLDLRVSALPTTFGDKVVVRVLDPSMLLRDVSELGFLEDEKATLEQWLARPNGLVLVTGPTGSGKTTTLYSALRAIATPELNVLTLEDPIEVVMDGITQVAANVKTGTNFAEALRHVLRQDPDVLMIGEIRDRETAEHALQAALTGHLVLSTLHTNDAVGAVARLSELGAPPFLVAATLTGVVAQRLVRKVCSACGEDVVLTVDEMAALGVRHPDEYAGQLVARRGVGCPRCRYTGYYGRSGVFELFGMNARMRQLASEGTTPEALHRAALQDGLRTLRDHAIRKVALGVTSIEEALRVTADLER
jgi:general secretion pathway protein E